MFNSVFTNGTTIAMIFTMIAISLVSGIIYAYLASLRLRASKGVFITAALMPMIISLAISLLSAFLSTTSTTVARIATLAVALGLIRFRSINGSAEEMLILLGSVIVGLVFGLGYLAYGVIAMFIFIGAYIGLSYLPIFRNKKYEKEKTLKITIPESLNYTDVFNDAFDHYLKEYELVGVKTTAMGSMFKLTYRVVLKNPKEEKELIDELRIRNGNLEISILPFVEPNKNL